MANDIISLIQNDPAVGEAYRTLRTGVQFAGLDRSLRSLLVCSAANEDGRSQVAAGLAAAFAIGGARTVLVDANLRQPVQHSAFGLTNELGLTSAVLAGEQASLPVQATSLENLSLLAAGPELANPVDLFNGPVFAGLFEKLLGEFEMTVVDAPPVLAVADAAVLSRQVDGVLFVSRSGKTKREHAVRARETLEKVGANLLGAALTDAKLEPSLQKYFS